MSIESKVKQLHRPAIDAYMASFPDYYGIRSERAELGSVPEFPDGDPRNSRAARGYCLAYPDMWGQRLVVELPDANGNGGGRILLCRHRSTHIEEEFDGDPRFFINRFNDIRGALESRFGSFYNLPKPSEFDSELDAVKAAINALALDFHDLGSWSAAPDTGGSSDQSSASGTSGGAQSLPSDLLPHLNVIFANLSNADCFSGTAILPLKARYVTGLQVSTRALYGLLFVYGGHIAAEQELWRAADETLDHILDAAGTGFAEVVANSTHVVDWNDILKVTGIACKGLALLATATGVGAPAAPVFGLIGLGVTSLEEVVPDEVEGQDTMASYNEVVDFMNTAVKQFRAMITHEEQLIQDNVAQNLDSIAQYRSYYDLQGPLFDDQNRAQGGGHNQITWLPSAAAEVSTSMREASGYYETAASKLPATSIWDAAKRPYLLGTSTTGPAQALDDMGAMIRTLLMALGAELEQGAAHVDAATNLFMAAEKDYQGKIATLESEVDLVAISTLDPSAETLDPLAPGAPEIEPLDVQRIMGG